MNKFMNALRNSIGSFARDEEGAQVVEYALIIAVVSIALVIALSTLLSTGDGAFKAFVDRVIACLSTNVCA